jgi:parallel beta-helix repeat protein
MKRKIFSTLFALVLLAGFSLVTAVPAGAVGGGTPSVTLDIPANVYRPSEFVASSTTTNLEGGTEYTNARFNITLSGPAAFPDGTVREDIFTITEVNGSPDTQGINDTFVLVDGDFVGYWGPVGGFPLAAPYEATSAFTILMTDITTAPVGAYEVIVELVDLTPDPDVILASAMDGFSLSADTLYVGAGQQFTTIQHAIDGANSGDTINVAAGTYNEVVLVNKPLQLLGAQAGVDARTRAGPESVIDPNDPGGGQAKSWVVRVRSSDVTVDGFTVQNPTLEYGSAGLFYVEPPSGILYENLVFTNNILQNPGIKTSPSTDWGKFGYDIGNCDNVLIEYNYIRDILCDTATPWNGTAAIWPWGTTGLKIRYNKIEHVTTFGVGLSDSNSNVLILENEVSLGDPGEGAVPSVSTAGIRVGPSQNDDVHIEGNSIYNCPGTVAQPGAGIRIQTYPYLEFGTGIERGSFTYAIDNVVTGCPIGVRTTADAAGSQIEIEGNTFEDNEVQVSDGAESLIIEDVLTSNTFDRAVVVDHSGSSLLPTIWSKIQDGIDAASPSDTINVVAGTYTEEINIGVPNLTLQSASKWGAIIKPDTTPANHGAAVYISVDGVTVDGFEIDGTTFCNNGIYGWETSGLTIKNNKIHGAVNAWDGCGILLISWGNASTVENNLIQDNEVYDTGRMGIMVMDHDGTNYTVTSGNTITGNIVYDVWKKATVWNDGGGGIQINVAKGCSITNNEVYNVQNSQRGVYIFGSAEGNTITGNTLRDNPIGIQVWISGEGGTTIDWGADTPASPTIHFNNIYGNSDHGAKSTNIEGTPMIIDAANNWWGDRTGPKQADSNPGGKGDEISANVYYEPWLTKVSEDVIAEGVGYYGYAMVHLNTGWNILSTPFALDSDSDTWGKFAALNELSDKLYTGGQAIYANAYYYDSASQDWGQVTSSYQLKPGDAIYVKMAEPDIAALLASPALSTPQKTLRRGWNLVGLSWQPTETTGPMAKSSDYLKTVETVGTLPGYTLVVSPFQNQESWTYLAGDAIGDEWRDEQPNPGWMVPTKGYWVVMENGPDVLYGTWMTPMGLPR